MALYDINIDRLNEGQLSLAIEHAYGTHVHINEIISIHPTVDVGDQIEWAYETYVQGSEGYITWFVSFNENTLRLEARRID